MNSHVIKLNVGGVVFATTHSTLDQFEGFFRALVRSEGAPVGEVFIDRDPTHFRHVLNFLRNSPTYPVRDHELVELAQEADFYNLPALQYHASQRVEVATKSTLEYRVGLIGAKM